MDEVREYRNRKLNRLVTRFKNAETFGEKLGLAIVISNLVMSERDRKDGGEGSGNFGHTGRPGKIGGSGESYQMGGLKNSELTSRMNEVFKSAKDGTHFSMKLKGHGIKGSYDIYKVSDGYYVRSKNGDNNVVPTAEKAVEMCGVYNDKLVSNKVMYDDADMSVGDPETEDAKKFCADYEAYKEASAKLHSGDYSITEVDDETAHKYADTLNNASKSKIAKLAEQDPQFRAVVDNISAYTQGEYTMQRIAVENILKNGYDPSKDIIIGDRLTDSSFLHKDMYNGQNLSVSSASVGEGMLNLTRAVNNSNPYDGELYRVTQDRSILKSPESGQHGVYVPPKVGDTIRIDAPTSFSSDKSVVNKLAEVKMGDIIHYTVESGAHAVDVSKLSPYKQAELLTCGSFEVVKVDAIHAKTVQRKEEYYTKETIEVLKQTRNATVSDGYVTYPSLETHIVLRQKDTNNGDSRDDARDAYRPEDFIERMCLEEYAC